MPNRFYLYDPAKLGYKYTNHQQCINSDFHVSAPWWAMMPKYYVAFWQNIREKGGRGRGREILPIIKRQSLAINQIDRDTIEVLHEFQPLRIIQNRQNLNPMLQCTVKDYAELFACSWFIYLLFSTGIGWIFPFFFNRVNSVGKLEELYRNSGIPSESSYKKPKRLFLADRFRYN